MIHNVTQKVAVAAIGALAISGASLLPAGASPQKPAKTEFTQEQILDGVVFSSGPVARELGTARVLSQALDGKQRKVLKETTQQLKDSIVTHDDGDLAAASDLVTSGDVYQVEEGLTLFSGMYIDALEREFPEAVVDPTAKKASVGTEPSCVVGPAVAVAAAGVIFVGIYNVAGHANAVLYQNGVYWESNAWTGKSASTPGLLLPSPQNDESASDASESISLAQAESVKLVTENLGNQ